MICVRCGTAFAGEANFCSNCGAPRNTGSSVDAPANEWETCEIVDRYRQGGFLWLFAKIWFEVEVVSPMGRYIVASTPPIEQNYDYRPDWHAEDAWPSRDIDTLVADLGRGGWQSLSRGQKWYSYRFHRQWDDGSGRIGQHVTVSTSGGNGAFLHGSPRMADRLRPLAENSILELIERDTVSDQRRWKHVRETNGRIGWVDQEYIR